jgi:arylsulfatase A-like enzyme
MITGVDLAVGRLVAHLRERSLLDNTLLVFSSDHGDHCGDHRMILKGCTFYDELMHLPLILHWPAGLGATPRRIDGIVEMVDLLPTLLELCGIPVPRVMAGCSFAADLLAGRDPAGREDAIATHDPGHLMLRTATHKYIRWASGGEALFDLEKDPGEFVNVARSPAYRETRHALIERMLVRSVECSRSAIRRVGRF